MRVLGVDTTTSLGSVAVADSEGLVAEVCLRADQGHSRWLVPAIDFLLRSAGLARSDIEGFGVAEGPGSFTGLRVGLATVQGLAEGSGRRCVGVPTLDALAAASLETERFVAAMLDAYRGQVFGAVYEAPGRVLIPCRAEPPLRFVELIPEGAAVVGGGAERYADLIQRERPDLRLVPGGRCIAWEVARLARLAILAEGGGDPASLRPVYLREAEIRKSQS